MKIQLDFDESELKFMIKEEWYKQAKYEIRHNIAEVAATAFHNYVNQNHEDFERVIKECVKELIQENKDMISKVVNYKGVK